MNTPKLDSDLTAQLNQLIDKFINSKSILITNEGKSSDDNIYSVKDLKKYMGGKMPKFEEEDLEILDSDDSTSVIENTLVNDTLINKDVDKNNHWKMASGKLKLFKYNFLFIIILTFVLFL